MNKKPAIKVSKADADKILGDYHGLLFQLAQEARKSGDTTSDAVVSYLHDEFCKTRTKLAGERRSEETDAPYPKFRRRAKAERNIDPAWGGR